MSLDWNGAKVTGAIKASSTRVLWREGRLYVALSPKDVRSFDVPELPRRNGGTYNFTDHNLAVIRPSCGCQKNKALGQMSVEQIVEAAQVHA